MRIQMVIISLMDKAFRVFLKNMIGLYISVFSHRISINGYIVYVLKAKVLLLEIYVNLFYVNFYIYFKMFFDLIHHTLDGQNPPIVTDHPA